jgi:hypothetical protein
VVQLLRGRLAQLKEPKKKDQEHLVRHLAYAQPLEQVQPVVE